MLLLNEDGSVRDVTWWNSFYLCPAYAPTLERSKALVRRILGDWGFAGLKIDGQHLNGVAPCYNPAHKHARPEESFEKLQDFWKAIYDTAMSINPEAVVEICPCGTSYAFHNMPAMNQTVASDPESSWQVRLKGKTIKALMGSACRIHGRPCRAQRPRRRFRFLGRHRRECRDEIHAGPPIRAPRRN